MAWKDGETISPLGLNRIEEAVASMNESYTPTVWQVGDVITAEKLNKIEEGIANAGQPSWETLFEGSVTTITDEQSGIAGGTVDYLFTSEPPRKLKITFNGTTYECDATILEGGAPYVYGGYNSETGQPDFTDYPFELIANVGSVFLVTPEANTYTLKIEGQGVQPTNDFTTFNVTITNNSATYYKVDVAFIEEGSMILYTGASSNHTRSLEVVLYKGEAKMSIYDNNGDPVPQRVVSITGNASYDGTEFIVTGDCTITILAGVPE